MCHEDLINNYTCEKCGDNISASEKEHIYICGSCGSGKKERQLKEFLKIHITECAAVLDLQKFGKLVHPTRIIDLAFHVNAIQQSLITEYARHSELANELDLRRN